VGVGLLLGCGAKLRELFLQSLELSVEGVSFLLVFEDFLVLLSKTLFQGLQFLAGHHLHAAWCRWDKLFPPCRALS